MDEFKDHKFKVGDLVDTDTGARLFIVDKIIYTEYLPNQDISLSYQLSPVKGDLECTSQKLIFAEERLRIAPNRYQSKKSLYCIQCLFPVFPIMDMQLQCNCGDTASWEGGLDSYPGKWQKANIFAEMI